jgi:hypothetical protein
VRGVTSLSSASSFGDVALACARWDGADLVHPRRPFAVNVHLGEGWGTRTWRWYDSFLDGPEIAARRRLADLRESKRAADRGYGPPLPPAQEAALRLLALLYPLPRPPKPDDKTLAEHPFADLEDFEEFVDVPPLVIGNPNYPPEERGPDFSGRTRNPENHPQKEATRMSR